MKKIILLLLIIVLYCACGVKRTQRFLSSGDYDSAIENAVSNLRTNKDKKGKQDFVYLLEEAFAKAIERDLRDVDFMKKEGNASNSEKIYNTYLLLISRQEKIRPILPLNLIREKRPAIFLFNDYSDELIKSRIVLTNHLYSNAKALLNARDKMSFRRAYDDLAYLNKLTPNFKDVVTLMNEAAKKGTDFVQVYAKNETNMVIPIRLQNDLLDISTYNLDDRWTIFHSTKQSGINYDYGLLVNFRQINVSPEQIKEREFVKERLVKFGTKKMVDARGNVVLDEKGNAILVDDMRTTQVSIYEFGQFKSTQVVAKVDYVDYKTNQLLQTFPLESTFNFENTYATFQGDRRAADDNYNPFFDRRAMPFPPTEQMIFNCGEDLKNKLKFIVSRNRFRN